MVYVDNQSCFPVYEFNDKCGTSIAFRSDLIHKHMNDSLTIEHMLSRHRFSFFNKICGYYQRHSLGNIPRAAYVQHSQNHGRGLWRWSKDWEAGLPITDKIRQTFCIPG